MQAVRPGDDDRIHVRVLQHLLVVGVRLGAVLAGQLRDAIGDRVGQGDELRFGVGDALGDVATLAREVAAWQAPRNEVKATVDWRFGVGEARTKLKRLYPVTTPVAED